MTDNKNNENIVENDLDLEELIEETKQLEQEENKTNEEILKLQKENEDLKELLARTQADYQNFKFRTGRDSVDNIFYAKQKILKNILPVIDDLQRIIQNTPEDQKETSVYTWTVALKQKLDKTLTDLWVQAFDSIGQEINPDLHDVMTQIPNPEMAWKIVDEFEKWYMLDDRVLRVAKVIVAA